MWQACKRFTSAWCEVHFWRNAGAQTRRLCLEQNLAARVKFFWLQTRRWFMADDTAHYLIQHVCPSVMTAKWNESCKSNKDVSTRKLLPKCKFWLSFVIYPRAIYTSGYGPCGRTIIQLTISIYWRIRIAQIIPLVITYKKLNRTVNWCQF